MKQYLPILLILISISLSACRGGRSGTRSEEKDLATLIKRLNKKGGDDKIIADLQEVYGTAFQKAALRLDNYRYDAAPQKWDKIIPELEGLQRMYETISQSAYALRMIKPVNYYPRLVATKDSAAGDYYQYGTEQLQQNLRENNKEAYYAFEKANRFVPNYRDSKQLMKEAFERSIVHVLINEVQYDDWGNSNWNFNQYNNNDRMLHNNLIRDLGGQTSTSIPARFYDAFQLRQQNSQPDIVTDLVWRNLRFDQPRDYTRSYNRSKQIETGRDTANRPIYTTVTATVHVTQRQLNADAEMNVILTDAAERTQIGWDRLPAEYRYTYEYADYTGDRRALDANDLTLINRSRNQQLPSRQDAMNEMMRRVYQDIVNRVRNKVNW
ncbi:MAG: hypothetical protein K2Q24_17055 [Chitinophagaceae bacterium]|jgi:hypothetical protein|nr:hypothetical protein [Chitinophagaceae bacterium]